MFCLLFISSFIQSCIVRTESQEDLNIWQLKITICSSKTCVFFFFFCDSTLKPEPHKILDLYKVQNLKPEPVPTFLSLL